MERSKRKSRPSVEGLEGRMLLNGSKVQATVHAAANSKTELVYATPQGSHVDVKITGGGNLVGSTVDSAGQLNLVFSGTTVFSAITGTVTGGNGQARLASLREASVPIGSLTGLGGDLVGRVLLPSFNLIAGGAVNLTSGVQVLTLNSVSANSQLHLRDTPLNTTLGLASYVNTLNGHGQSYARLSSTSTGSTTSSASGLSSGSSIGVATGSSAGGVTTLGSGTLNPTAVGFGGGSVGSINGAIPIINTVGNGENDLGTPGLTQAQVSQGRTTNYVIDGAGGEQLSTIGGTFVPGANLIEPSDVSLPAGSRVPPPGVILTINHVYGGTSAVSPPLGHAQIYGYDATANALIRFDAVTGAALQSIALPASTAKVGGISLASDGAQEVVLVGIGSNVLAFNADDGAAVGQFSTSSLAGEGLTTVTGIASASQKVFLEDAADGPTGTLQAVNVAQSLASGVAVPVGSSFSPTREFSLAGTVTGVPGGGNLYALGSAFLDVDQPNIKQSGILTVNPIGNTPVEATRTAILSTTGAFQAAGANNGLASTTSLALGSVDSFLALDTGVVNGQNSIRLLSPNGLTSEGSFNLSDANPLADLSQSFHPELTNTALIDVQGNIQSFTAKSINGLVLNDAGNFNLLNVTNASNSSVIGLPFGHVEIATRKNVTITTNSRLVGTRGGVTVNPTQSQVGPLFQS